MGQAPHPFSLSAPSRHPMQSAPCMLAMAYPGGLLSLCLRQGLEGSKVDPEVSLKGLVHSLLKNNKCVQSQGGFSSGMPFASYETRVQSLHFIPRLPFPCSTPEGPAEPVLAAPALVPVSLPASSRQPSPSSSSGWAAARR